MKILFTILSFLGALGLFIYGMKVMSESLQKAAGSGLQKNLKALLKNKWKGIFSGTIITGLIQSSSATTVMAVSLVNAGLLTLYESASFIMGANIGTTFTAWLVALLGFNFNFGMVTLPLIGVSLFLYFSGKNYLKYWGEFIIGFALIFIGLGFIKNVFPDIQQNPGFYESVKNLTDFGFWSVLIFIAIGLLLTAIIQSSSIASTITLVMCYKGWIDFDLASAMILGENIGTTITANIAAIITNKTAKRAALFHTLFNLFGMLWAIPFFKLFVSTIIQVMIFITGKSPLSDTEAIPVALAAFHSLFNIINTMLLVWFIPKMITLTGKIIPSHDKEKEVFSLKYLYQGLMSTSELSMVQVKNEISGFGKKATRMFGLLQELFFETSLTEFKREYEEIKQYEQQSDKREQEITLYLTRLSEGDLSLDSSNNSRIMLKIVDELESVCDSIYNIARALKRKRKENIWFTQDIRDNLNNMFQMLQNAFNEMNTNLAAEYEQVDLLKALSIEKEINKYRKTLLQTNLHSNEIRDYKYEAAILYNDIFNRCERLGDYVYNVSKTIVELNSLKVKDEG